MEEPEELRNASLQGDLSAVRRLLDDRLDPNKGDVVSHFINYALRLPL